MEFKFFATKYHDAVKWGNLMNGKGNHTVITTEFNVNIKDVMMYWEKLDGIGPAYGAEINILNKFIK